MDWRLMGPSEWTGRSLQTWAKQWVLRSSCYFLGTTLCWEYTGTLFGIWLDSNGSSLGKGLHDTVTVMVRTLSPYWNLNSLPTSLFLPLCEA